MEPLYVANGKRITQIGSLPYKDVDKAIAYSLGHDIPFLPELPRLGDAGFDYMKNPGNLSCLNMFKNYDFDTVKVQIMGPATLMIGGYKEDEAIETLIKHTDAILKGLRAKEIILFFDEPSLGNTLDREIKFEELWNPLIETFNSVSSVPILYGVHCCGNMDWDRLFNSQIDIVSFDASKYDIIKYSGYRNGKKIAWGIDKAEDVKDWQEGDLLTLPCGMGSRLYSVDDCEGKLEMLQRVSKSYAGV